MMNRKSLFLLTALIWIPLMAEAQLATLTVIVQGLLPATGTVEVSLFNTAESFMKEPLLQKTQSIYGEEEIALEFASLLEGTYAIVVVHDENDNGVLDTGFLGFGGESFGYSNEASPLLGRPDFEAASIVINTDDQEIVINLD